MNTAIILAIVIVVLVAAIAGGYLLRTSRSKRGPEVTPDETPAASTAPEPTKPVAKPRKSAKQAKAPPEPTPEDVERVVREAEEILKAHNTGQQPVVTEADSTEETDSAGVDTLEPPSAETGTAEEPETPEASVDTAEAESASDAEAAADVDLAAEPEPAAPAGEPIVRPSFRERLGRARKAFTERISDIRLRRKIDEDVWDDLEETLILADVGAELANALVDDARRKASDEKAETADEVVEALRSVLGDRLRGKDRSLHRSGEGPTTWLVVGVNGTGKTTTIGKIAALQSDEGDKVVLAAADTFRAAAADQLEVWASRSGAELVRGQEGSDPSAVVFDAVKMTHARNCDLLLVDTAGRLHTKVNLMEELKKIRRVAENAGSVPNEVLLVLDATTGQNGLIQAREFAGAAGVTGVVLTKLDGTAKGGIAFAIEQEFGIPIKLVGLGEQVGDLVPFDPDEFVDALFA